MSEVLDAMTESWKAQRGRTYVLTDKTPLVEACRRAPPPRRDADQAKGEERGGGGFGDDTKVCDPIAIGHPDGDSRNFPTIMQGNPRDPLRIRGATRPFKRYRT
jgi:hypothetical protein